MLPDFFALMQSKNREFYIKITNILREHDIFGGNRMLLCHCKDEKR